MSTTTHTPPAPSARALAVQANLMAAQANPNTLLTTDAVMALTGWSKTTIWRRIKDGSFPQSIELGANERRWQAGTVNEWLAQRAGV